MNVYEESPYAGMWHLPQSEVRKLDTVFLPLFYGITDADVARVAGALAKFVE